MLLAGFVPVSEAIQQTATQRLEQIGDSLLWNAITAVGAARRIKGGDGQQLGVSVAGEGRALRPVIRVVNVRRIQGQVRVVHVAQAANKEVVLAGRTVGRRIL